MVIKVDVPVASESRLIELARQHGKSVEIYASELLHRAVQGSKSYSEILAPFRREVAESNIDDSSLDSLFESSRTAVASTKQ